MTVKAKLGAFEHFTASGIPLGSGRKRPWVLYRPCRGLRLVDSAHVGEKSGGSLLRPASRNDCTVLRPAGCISRSLRTAVSCRNETTDSHSRGRSIGVHRKDCRYCAEKDNEKGDNEKGGNDRPAQGTGERLLLCFCRDPSNRPAISWSPSGMMRKLDQGIADPERPLSR